MKETSVSTPIYIEPDKKRIPLTLMQPLPAPICCQHPSVDLGKPEDLDGSVVVDVVCLADGCGHIWRQVKVRSRTIADRAREEGREYG